MDRRSGAHAVQVVCMSRGLLRQIVLNCGTNSCYYYKVFFSYTPSPHVFSYSFQYFVSFLPFFFHSSLKWNRHQRIFYYRISLSLPSGGRTPEISASIWEYVFFSSFFISSYYLFFTSFSFLFVIIRWRSEVNESLEQVGGGNQYGTRHNFIGCLTPE